MTATRLHWIKRRARSIERFYAGVRRREALLVARDDWWLLHGRRLRAGQS